MSDTGLFANESAPYAPFKTVGTTYEGVVVRTGKSQQRKYVPPKQREAGVQGDLEFWPDGQPKWVYIVTLQTDLRDPDIPGDDGQRSVWISGKQMSDAVKKAVKDSGAREGIVVGGHFSIRFTHTTPNDWTDTPTKHYEVTYRPPQPGANTADPWANVPTQQDPWGQTPQPAYAQGGHVQDGHIQDTAGLPPAVMEQLTPEARQALARLTQGGNR